MLSMLLRPFSAYAHWLHTRWPAGTVEKLPLVNTDGSTNVPGVYIAGDLTGIPLLKFSLDSGARAVQTIAEDSKFQAIRSSGNEEAVDVVIIGGGVAGMAAAVEARKRGLSYIVLEASRPFSTIVNFPAGKPIYTYPNEMDPAGDLKVTAQVKEALVEELERQAEQAKIETSQGRAERIVREGQMLKVHLAEGKPLSARRVIVAIGRTGNFRKLGVPGEDLAKVYNRLHDPKDFCGTKAMVVGGGDSALETAIALAQCGADVTLSYRRKEFSRAKPENIEGARALAEHRPCGDLMVEHPTSPQVTTATGAFVTDSQPAPHPEGCLRLALGTNVKEIRENTVTLVNDDGSEEAIENDVVFSMIGREPPLDFFRRSKIRISGEGTWFGWVALILFLIFCVWMYDWKSGGLLADSTQSWPDNSPALVGSLGSWWESAVSDRSTVIGTLAVSMKSRSFYYTLAYSLAVLIFGIARIRRRRTPYVTVQTSVLIAIQVIPLFLLPELLLPWMGYNGWFDSGIGGYTADSLFEKYISAEAYAAGQWPDWGHPRAYWRAYGLILAWPLMIYNVFTENPMWWWLGICFIQTFVFIPGIIYFWGKGAYCGWICSCGALAETVGDQHRHKMPHGPFWNRLNMAGQAILWVAFILLFVRIGGWVWPDSWMNQSFSRLVEGKSSEFTAAGYLSYKWIVDVFFAGILGVGLYFKYSGRVWCRFFCPLAALMHFYTRFSRFRIFADKKKCISCNVCTSVCHQGIDIMNFANKGVPMEDPECVRCSACVQSCPTGVLTFGQIGRDGQPLRYDSLPASPVQMAEGHQFNATETARPEGNPKAAVRAPEAGR